MSVVVIGVGNRARRDDGLGPAVADLIAACPRPGVRVFSELAESAALLDAWAGADLAVVVDAVLGDVAAPPGRVRRRRLDDFAAPVALSSHDLDLRQTFELGRALGRAPGAVVVVTVDAADVGHGQGLSPAVAAALPEAVRVVESALAEHAQEAAQQAP